MTGERPRKIYYLTDTGRNMLNFTEDSLNLICKKITVPTIPEIAIATSTQLPINHLLKKSHTRTSHITINMP
jgi:DNA-binding PadR family transcriptional regulator